MTMQQSTIKSFPYIRVIACFAIVILHTLFASVVYYEKSMTDTQFLIESVFQNLLMWAVPCFLMITGALLLNPEKEVSWKKIGKYIFRVALALVFFTLLFEVIDHIFGTKGNIFTNWLYKLYTGQSWAHMWYLYLLIGLYLMVPFYKMITKNASLNQIGILILIIVFFVSVLPLVDNVTKLQTSFYIPTSIIYPAVIIHTKKMQITEFSLMKRQALPTLILWYQQLHLWACK